MSETRATIIFDFDGTLANSVDLMMALYNEHAEQFGYDPMKKSELPKLRRMGYRKAMKTKGIKFRLMPRMAITIGREMRGRMSEVEPYDQIVETLESLQKEGFSIGILTSNQAALVKEFLKDRSFPDFDFVVSEKTLFGKDKALKKIVHRYGLSKEQVIYVGDEPRDVHASVKAGVAVIGVTWGLGGKEGFEKARPTATVDTPRELKETIIELSAV